MEADRRIDSAEEILEVLATDAPEAYREALIAADAHREALVGPLLDALDRGIADPRGTAKADAAIFSYALYLLAKWRDPRAYAPVVRWLSLAEEEPFDIAGDVVTQDGGRILASVCGGDLEPIKALVLKRDADEYGRSAGITALTLLAAWGDIPRSTVIEYFLWLAREGLEREPSLAWDSLAADCADIEAVELLPDLLRAYDEGLIDPQFISRPEIVAIKSTPPGERLRQMLRRHPRIDDVAAATAWWDRKVDNADIEVEIDPFDDDDDDLFEDDLEPFETVAKPYRAPPKIGRNQPCPCGSGKKYKKCHGG